MKNTNSIWPRFSTTLSSTEMYEKNIACVNFKKKLIPQLKVIVVSRFATKVRPILPITLLNTRKAKQKNMKKIVLIDV